MRTCVVCDVTEQDADLTDIRVIVAYGEEGQAMITRYVCDTHLDEYCDIFVGMGFCDHDHGGINFLEDTNCDGTENPNSCPLTAREQEEDLVSGGAQIFNLDAYRKR